MSYADQLNTLQTRLAANLPNAAVSGSSRLSNLLQTFIAGRAELDQAITGSAANQYLQTAAGTGLDAKLLDYNYSRGGGLAAGGQVTFSIPNGGTAPTTIAIPANTVVGTIGDYVTTIPQTFKTQLNTDGSVPTIASGGTSVTVNVVAAATGSAGNVLSGTIVVIYTNISVALLGVTNASATSGGTDSQSDDQARVGARAALAPKYGNDDLVGAAIGAGAYDAAAVNGSAGSGTCTVYYCDVNGAQVLLYPSMVAPPSGAQLSDLVPPAVNGALPSNLSVSFSNFNLQNYTSSGSIVTSFTAPLTQAPTTAQQNAVTAAIQTAVAAYMQQLGHNQQPNTFQMGQYVSTQLQQLYGVSILNFGCSTSFSFSTTPYLYRCTGTPTTVVTASGTFS